MINVDIQVKELEIKVYLTKSLDNIKSLEEISKLIDQTLSKDKEYLKFHKEIKYKNYNFSSFFPIERSKIYLEGNIYTFRLRTIDQELINFLNYKMLNEYTKFIKVLGIKEKNVPKKHIEKIYSITPALIKLDEGYWRDIINMDSYEKRIKENLIKKYNDFFNIKMNEDFELFTRIQFDNRKPIGMSYKNIKLLGDKLTLMINDNENAQKLSYLALGTGILENNARGYGYCNFKWI